MSRRVTTSTRAQHHRRSLDLHPLLFPLLRRLWVPTAPPPPHASPATPTILFLAHSEVYSSSGPSSLVVPPSSVTRLSPASLSLASAEVATDGSSESISHSTSAIFCLIVESNASFGSDIHQKAQRRRQRAC